MGEFWGRLAAPVDQPNGGVSPIGFRFITPGWNPLNECGVFVEKFNEETKAHLAQQAPRVRDDSTIN